MLKKGYKEKMDSWFSTRDSKRNSKDIKHGMKYLRWSTELLTTWFGKGRRQVLRTLRGGANQLSDCGAHDGSISEILACVTDVTSSLNKALLDENWMQVLFKMIFIEIFR